MATKKPNPTVDPVLVAPAVSRLPAVGDTVHYVMADGVTIRPAIIVAFVAECNEKWTAGLQVFVDGSHDDASVRGPHANATLQDWKPEAPYDPGKWDDETTRDLIYAPKTWHFI